MREETLRLLKQADRDLENARRNIDIGACEVAAFLAEQSVEKYLKGAFLEVKRTAAPRTHYLMELGQEKIKMQKAKIQSKNQKSLHFDLSFSFLSFDF